MRGFCTFQSGLLHDVILPSSTHFPAYFMIFLFPLRLNKIQLCAQMCHIFITHSSAAGHLGWSRSLTTVNRAAVNMGVMASLWSDTESFKQKPRSDVTGSRGSSIFEFLRSRQCKLTLLLFLFVHVNRGPLY